MACGGTTMAHPAEQPAMSWLQKTYASVPVPLQNLGITIYGWGWRRRRFGGVFQDTLAGFKNREAWTNAQFHDYQTIEFRKLLVHAFSNSPFYQNQLLTAGFRQADLQKFELQNLSKLPLLSKTQLRTLGDTELLARKREHKGRFFSSSGSTGTPTRVLFSHPMHQRWTAAVEARVRHWAGLNGEVPRGTIGGRRVVPEGAGRPPFYRFNLVERQVYFSAYHISADNAPDYLQGMTHHRIDYMTGYAMSNYFLARFFEQIGVSAPNLKAVLTSSEKLSPEMRATFQRVYGCRTYDAWSGVEACGLVSECEHGRLHISPDVGILEFLSPETGAPAAPGALAEVVCTGLLNYDQPLIRYRIGDLMRLSKATCPCGRSMPVVEELVGRMEDTIIGPDGRQMVRFHNLFTEFPQIIAAQVVQENYDLFQVRVETETPLDTQTEQQIQARMQSQLGQVQVQVVTVKSIPRGANGKFKAVVSHLPEKP